MSGAYTVAGLLFALEAVGVGVALNEAGDGLKLSGRGSPPADLLAEVRRLKPDLLAHLKAATAKEEAAGGEPSSSPDVGEVFAKSGGNPSPLPDWAEVAAQAGHCGSCARASDASQEWGALMVTCGCPSNAFEGSLKPLALHVGHRCAAYRKEGEDVGKGWRSKDSGKRWGLAPPPPTSWEDLPSLEDGHGLGGAA